VPEKLSDAAEAAHRALHRTIDAVTRDLEDFHFNRAVARIRELTNLLGEIGGDGDGEAWVLRRSFDVLVRLIEPMMPHLAEELWQRLGHEALLSGSPWPEADPALLVEDTVTIAVQINGKLRGTIDVARDADRAAVEQAALAVPKVADAIAGKEVRKVIVVPNRIVNVVV
jgi:leucyl-tRNA synthetase